MVRIAEKADKLLRDAGFQQRSVHPLNSGIWFRVGDQPIVTSLHDDRYTPRVASVGWHAATGKAFYALEPESFRDSVFMITPQCCIKEPKYRHSLIQEICIIEPLLNGSRFTVSLKKKATIIRISQDMLDQQRYFYQLEFEDGTKAKCSEDRLTQMIKLAEDLMDLKLEGW